MQGYVKIRIENKDGKVLEHHYVRKSEWGLPAGRIEESEAPKDAAVRELLERTGFSIEKNKLSDAGMDGDFHLFTGREQDAAEVAKPGEKGGYLTSIRWA